MTKTRTRRTRTAVRRKADPGLTFDYKDTETLRRFLTDRGRIRRREVTGLSPQRQRQLATAVRNAREMALLPFGG
ncbi:30S ribosomal protein S18 2 [Gordonia spumicola]|uniref:Small ribosomal subunit protein bS18 n=1 Tax=Gordonia spumicola TaxID=589161 RepID=A0A7I9V3I3_9ACTN|nr:30S ribosomal protein S18 [Gordonia spumicola]GED99599.1 30S ribosomal protein S18 2 [Gordonia spumicola]